MSYHSTHGTAVYDTVDTSLHQGPGRIDKMFHLNYMVGEQACKMIAHYFQQDWDEDWVIFMKVILTWRLPEIGVPPVIIHFNGSFHHEPTILDTSICGKPHIL